MPIIQENIKNPNYIWHHPDVNRGFILLSKFPKLLGLGVLYLGLDRLQENLEGGVVNSGEKEALKLMTVGLLTIIGSIVIDYRANVSVSANVDIIAE